MMRINGKKTGKPAMLIVTPWLGSGGIERNIEVVAPWFASRGHRVKVLSWIIEEEMNDQRNPVLETLKHQGVAVQRLSAYGRLKLIQRATQVAAIALAQRFSILVGYELEGNLVAILAKLLLAGRVRAFAQVHNSSEAYEAFGLGHIARRLGKALYRRADGIVAVSEAVRQDTVNFFQVDVSLVKTIHNPVPIETIRSQATASGADREFDTPHPFIMGCGRLVEMKGFRDLIEAFSMLQTEEPLDLLILGTGNQRNALITFAANQGVSERVLFPGFRPNPHRYFTRAKAFVLSSLYGEAFPLVLLEAMACGVPVVSSRCHWGPEEILENGKHGLLYPVGDVGGLTASLSRILNEPHETAARVKMALARVDEFSERAVLPKLEALFFSE
jgi:glycosyltransferase involved in cell wall biosynthesis